MKSSIILIPDVRTLDHLKRWMDSTGVDWKSYSSLGVLRGALEYAGTHTNRSTVGHIRFTYLSNTGGLSATPRITLSYARRSADTLRQIRNDWIDCIGSELGSWYAPTPGHIFDITTTRDAERLTEIVGAHTAAPTPWLIPVPGPSIFEPREGPYLRSNELYLAVSWLRALRDLDSWGSLEPSVYQSRILMTELIQRLDYFATINRTGGSWFERTRGIYGVPPVNLKGRTLQPLPLP